jgi:hypothetical protein
MKQYIAGSNCSIKYFRLILNSTLQLKELFYLIKMLFIREPSRRHAELVSASLGTVTIRLIGLGDAETSSA